MKRLMKLCMFFLLLATLAPEGFATISIKVGIYENPPLSSMSPDGNPCGLAVDVLQRIAEKAGWQLEYVPGTFQEGLNRLRKGRLDLFLAVAETPERAKFASFSKEPIVSNWGQTICQQGESIASLPDLSGHVIAVLKGDVFYTGPNGIAELTRKFDVHCQFLELDTYSQVLTAVALGKADAGVVSRFSMFSGDIPRGVGMTQVVFSPISVSVAAQRGKEFILSRFDRELRQLKQGPDSPYDAILSRWLVRPATIHSFWKTHRAYFVPVILVLVLLSVYTFFLLFLVQEKSRQTRGAYRKLSQEIEIHRQTTRQLLALSSLVEQAEEGVIIVDSEGRLLLSNPAADKFFGLDFSVHSGKHLAQVMGGETGFLDAILAETNSGHNWNGQAELEGDGDRPSPMILNISAFPVRGPGGEILFNGITMWDVTRERKLEERVRQKQELELLGQMAGGVAHEFNNLLTVIRGSAELIELRATESKIKDLSMTVLHSSDRAAVLVSQLLGFSRRQMRLPRPLDLETELPEITEMLSRLIPENIVLDIEISPDLPPLEADPTQIHQVLANLVTNARDALQSLEKPESIPVIGIRIYPIALDGAAAERLDLGPGQYVAIEVSDNGHGIKPELKDRIFEPFFTTKEVGQGSGLGLATVEGISRQNGGAVTVSNKEAGGSIFTVYWPVPAEPPELPVETTEETGNLGTFRKGTEGRGKTVLVVEDESAVLGLATEVLKEMGFEVWSAENGRKALRILEEVPEISIMISDVIMPGMSGAELADKVAELKRKIKIVFTSGYDRAELMRHGIDEQSTVLLKPYSVNELREVLLSLIKAEQN